MRCSEVYVVYHRHTTDSSLDKLQHQAHVRAFFNMTVYHVLQRAGALKHLCDVERARHVNRLVDLLDEGLVHQGHVPKLKRAKDVAKDVVAELQERYGDKLPLKMLKEYELEEVVVVFSLQKHINKLFEQAAKKRSSSPSWMWFRSFLRR